jgi:drug/metabolite transporter (DMT)-like permease
MLAILGGALAAVAWAASLAFAASATRVLGSAVTTAWVMTVGLALLAVPLAISGLPHLDAEIIAWLLMGGIGEFVGLLLTFRAVSTGDLGVVGPIISAEGGITAAIAILAGESVAVVEAFALAAVVVGVMLTARESDDGRDAVDEGERPDAERLDAQPQQPHRHRKPAVLATQAAACFGVGLYGIGRAGKRVPLVWAVLPPRLIAVLALALPLAARGQLRLTRATAPIVVAGGVCDLAGYFAYGWGARHDIGVTAVLATLSGAVSVAFGRALFGERLSRIQLAGVATITIGIAALSAVTG